MAEEEGLAQEGELKAVKCVFHIQPENYELEHEFDAQQTISQVKAALAEKLDVKPTNLSLHHTPTQDAAEGDFVADDVTLESLSAPLRFNLSISYLRNIAPPAFQLPSTVEVRVDFEDGTEPRLVHVSIDRAQAPKPFCGGYRHRNTGVEFHHATTQTARKPKVFDGTARFHRETQTVKVSTRAQQTSREAGTQMARRDLYLDNKKDRVVTPRPYFDADTLRELQEQMAVKIQCAVRQRVARQKARGLMEGRHQKLSAAETEASDRQAREEAHRQKQIQRRMHPRTKQDFQTLYDELEAWRLHETAQIKARNLPAGQQHQLLRELLEKETKLLQTIDRLKITANKQNRELRVHETLTQMAKPKSWERQADGQTIEVETPFTARAKELAEIYRGLRHPKLKKEERIDVLLHVKWTVKEFDCDLTREIVDLINRELDMVKRRRPDKSMQGLRKRLSNLFLRFVETPEFNPSASAFQKIPADLESEKGEAGSAAFDRTNRGTQASRASSVASRSARSTPRGERPITPSVVISRSQIQTQTTQQFSERDFEPEEAHYDHDVPEYQSVLQHETEDIQAAVRDRQVRQNAS